jgi:hypothetical protein
MKSASQQLAATYSSWPLEWRRGDDKLSTLSVFYDKVFLPCPYFFDAELPAFWHTDEDDAYKKQRDTLQSAFFEWKETIRPLIQHGIIEFLPSDFQISDAPQQATSVWSQLRTLSDNDLEAPDCALALESDMTSGAFAFDTSRLAAVLVDSLFSYRVPVLSKLTADQVLDVREHLKDYKAGFAELICELADDVEQRLQGGDRSSLAAAKKTVERKLLPKYGEFRRQLQSKKSGWRSKILERGWKALQIDASPCTPRFYACLFEALFGSLNEAAQAHIESASSQSQAFQYLASLEKRVDSFSS